MAITLKNERYYADEPFIIKRGRTTYFDEEPLHTHDFIEFMYIYKGKSDHIKDGVKFSMSKGDLLFINYESTHGYTSDGIFEYVNVIIKPDYVSKSLTGVENAFALLTLANFKDFSETLNRAKSHIHFPEDERAQFETLIELMEKEKENQHSGSEVISRSALDIFLTLIFRKMSLTLNDRMYLNAELLEYIKNNCGEDLTLNKVAAMCFYNSSYFSRAFKNFSGLGFTEYLTKCRIERACELLVTTDLKADTIMAKCGFSNRTRFFNKFYEQTGLSPHKYRKCKK